MQVLTKLRAVLGKSAEGAACFAALTAEVCGGKNDVTVVTMVSDLEKDFKKVLHSRLSAAAKVYDLPDKFFRLALDMYSPDRRIRCGARDVRTNMGVLVGCPIAMGALLLACMDQMEKFMRSIPKYLSLVKAYVDDIALTFKFDDPK